MHQQKKRRRKAQITIFFLMSIVLVMFFGLTVYLRTLDTGTKAAEDTEKILDTVIRTTTLKYYVTNCLDEATKEGLMLIGSQGGFIFSDQDYSVVDWEIPYANVSGGRIAYQIYSEEGSRFKADRPTLSTINYPCSNEKLSIGAGLLPEPLRSMLLPKYEEHIIGCPTSYTHENTKKNNLLTFGSTKDPEKDVQPELCKEDIKDERRLYKCACNEKINPLSCSTSIQAQLETYIAQKTLQCFITQKLDIDFSGYTFTVENVSADVTLGNKDTRVKLNFPIRLSKEGETKAIEVLEYETTQAVRFKRIYSLLFGGNLPIEALIPPNLRAVSEEMYAGAIKKEIDDITFDFVKEAQRLSNQKLPGVIVSKQQITDPKSEAYLDFLITVNDTLSNIDGKSFSFRFMIENRRPALDYISQSRLLQEYDVVAATGETILLEPLGVDADEELLEYSYSGWKSDEEECEENEQGEEYCYEPHEWENSNLYTTVGCLNPVTNKLEKERCASYNVKPEDVGSHITTISVSDLKGKKDIQRIRILVNDRPSPALYQISNGCKKRGTGFIPETFPISLLAGQQQGLEFKAECGDLTGGYYQYEWFEGSMEGERLTSDDIYCEGSNPVKWPNKIIMIAEDCEITCKLNGMSLYYLVRGKDNLVLLAKVKDRYMAEGIVSPALDVKLYDDHDGDGYCVGVDQTHEDFDDDAETGGNSYPGAPEICDDRYSNDEDNDGDKNCWDTECEGKQSFSGQNCCVGVDISACGGDQECFTCFNNICSYTQNDCIDPCLRCINGNCEAVYSAGEEDTTEYKGQGLCKDDGFACYGRDCLQP